MGTLVLVEKIIILKTCKINRQIWKLTTQNLGIHHPNFVPVKDILEFIRTNLV